MVNYKVFASIVQVATYLNTVIHMYSVKSS